MAAPLNSLSTLYCGNNFFFFPPGYAGKKERERERKLPKLKTTTKIIRTQKFDFADQWKKKSFNLIKKKNSKAESTQFNPTQLNQTNQTNCYTTIMQLLFVSLSFYIGVVLANLARFDENSLSQVCSGMYSKQDWGGSFKPHIGLTLNQFDTLKYDPKNNNKDEKSMIKIFQLVILYLNIKI